MENVILENRNTIEYYKLFDDKWDISGESEEEEKV